MSWSDSGSPTAARMLISLQRFEGAGLLVMGSLCASCDAVAACAVVCGRGFTAGRATAAGAGAGFNSGAFSTGLSAGSRGTLTARHGVLQGFASAAARAGMHCSAITIATNAITGRAEERAG
ncbi:hypothetical protein [Variovorax sp. PAMC26660]|uniref:hypothetical protein n=1 Tax=Variovorax sp. PAMC26660 TaxID=2762322 RepID=UPI00164D6309|nr:hypothetical protein [Variovorax sp. PAMC26660]QNK68464.1 hypothetical protein H7F35_01570 [Variovorax sp. PAMC26660]